MIHQLVPEFQCSFETQRTAENSVKPLYQEQLRINIDLHQFISQLMMTVIEQHQKRLGYYLYETLFKEVHLPEKAITKC